MHGIPLEPLGRMNRREHEVILVEMRRPRQIGARLRGIERQLGGEMREIRGLAGGGHELLEVGQADGPIGVASLDQRRQRVAQPLRLGAGAVGSHGLRERLDERVAGGPRTRREPLARLRPRAQPTRRRGADDHVERPPGGDRADAVEQLQHPKPGELVAGIADEPEQRDQVLDVGGLEVAQSTVLDEWDLAAGELELQQVAVMRGPHQHGLVAQLDPLLARLEHPLTDLVGLL